MISVRLVNDTSRAALSPAADVLVLRLFGQSVALDLASPQTRGHFAAQYRTEAGADVSADVEVTERCDGAYTLTISDTEYTWRGPVDDWPVTAEMLLLQHLLKGRDCPVVLHGAALATPRGGVCLVGPPGSGKTTLACALAASLGCQLLSDELVCLDAGGAMLGFPRLPRLDARSRGLLQEANLAADAELASRRAPGVRAETVLVLGESVAAGGASLAVCGSGDDVARLDAVAQAHRQPERDYWVLTARPGAECDLAAECWRRGLFVLGSAQPAAPTQFATTAGATPLSGSVGVIEATAHLRNGWHDCFARERTFRVASVLSRARFWRLQVGPIAETLAVIAELLTTP